jgi:3-dehydroquinate synthetase
VGGGERLKRLREVSGLYDKLVGSGADRRTCIIAIGGGTVTDAAGFAAATYMRGLAWAAVPTTILAMVDAAIGGKTGIDLPEGKNLVGAFWDPLVVAADLDSLGSLPAKQRRTGLAEIIKAAIVGDPELFETIESFSPRARPAGWHELIVAAARVKIAVVAGDPRDTNQRAVLNLGHTVGHALEYASGFRLPHGEAVAVGLRAEGMLAIGRGWWSARLQARLLRLLRICSLPAHASGLSTEKVIEGMRRDKKRTGGIHRFALPVGLGEVKAGVEVSETEIGRVVAACATPPTDGELSA